MDAIRFIECLSKRKVHKTVLVVEDDQVYAKIMRESLENKGCTVVSAESAEEVRGMDLSEIDLAVVDYRLPGANGVQCIRDIASRKANLCCVLHTGTSSNDPGVIEALNDGMTIVPKPLDTSLFSKQFLSRFWPMKVYQAAAEVGI